MSDRTELSSRTNLFSRTVLSFRESMSSFIKFIINLLTTTSTRVTPRTVLAYAADALYTDDPVVTELAVGEVAITGGRRISEGVWSRVDVNGVPFSPAPTMSNEDSTTNKCECVKANPTDTTNILIAAGTGTLSIADKTVELIAAGLHTSVGSVCAGNVYCYTATTDSFITITGSAGNTNKHSVSMYILTAGGSVDAGIDNVGAAGRIPFESDGAFTQFKYEDITPAAASKVNIQIFAGNSVYFILPDLEESPVATSVYYGDDTAAAATRGPDINTVPVSNVHTKDLGFERLEFTPYLGGQVNKYLRSFYIDATHTLDLYINATQVIAYYVDGANTDSAAFTYSHLQDVPMTAEFGWDSVANKLRVRAAASSGDISGETFAEATFAGMTALPATSYIGCKNDLDQAAGEFGNPIDYISAEVAGVL